MQTFLGILLSVAAVWLGLHMLRQARRREVDPFSVRNFFLLGFIVFQLSSGAITMYTSYYDALRCSDYAKAGLIFTVMVGTFLPLFLYFYRKGFLADRVAARLRERYGTVGPYALLLMAALFLVSALFWRFVLGQIPVLGVLAAIVNTGLAAAAAGLAAWVWAPRWSNPFVALVALTIIGGCLALAMYQDFGRRNSLNVLIACLWGAHHGHWKHVGIRRAIAQIVPLAAGAMLFIAAFTAGRKSALSDTKLGFSESVARLGKGDLSMGFLDMLTGQAAAACSMWIIETRPEVFPYDTFHTLRYFVGHPIPRLIWENKPIGLGSMLTVQGQIRNRSKEFSFGPGLMGHVFNDNPYLSMVPYAFGLAFMMRLMDRLIRLHPGNAFVIIPLGVALGDVLGLARGETGFFLARITIMTVSAWLGIGVIGMVMRQLGVVLPPAQGAPEPDVDLGDDQDLTDPHLAAEYTAQSDAEHAA